jgi:hypothetical protein
VPNDWLGKDVGKLQNTKELLIKAVQPRRPGTRRAPRAYEERDSVAIAACVVEDGSLASFQNGCRKTRDARGKGTSTRCASLERFRKRLTALHGSA